MASHGDQPLGSRLASLVSALRRRLDRRIGVRDPAGRPRPPTPPDPSAALRSGAGPAPLLDHGVPGRCVEACAARPPTSSEARSRSAPGRPGTAGTKPTGSLDTRCTSGSMAMPSPARTGHTGRRGPRWSAPAAGGGRARTCASWPSGPPRCTPNPAPDDACGEVRLHAADGPAVVCPDGWAVHSWHGTRAPAWVIEAPTAAAIAAESTVEVRRRAIERVGRPSFLEQAGLTLVGRSIDPGDVGHEPRLYGLPYRHHGARTRPSASRRTRITPPSGRSADRRRAADRRRGSPADVGLRARLGPSRPGTSAAGDRV
ncbi:hypothetical protein AHOG_17575 [Actinoalloteichus hoggarensis]|uniref:DUF6745 domain-containing protein n=1 Tax=Actinoalloteichus hoggarensis TaxID=1470176 RepID=A0A221W5H3_9PSEU|nr:hypothetical protein AHOG_17575 [Actinoalloteichus hoggarensis]